MKHSEREHVHREETDFKRLARRNKLFGLWAAEQLGFHGDAAEAYAREVIYSDLEEPGEDDMFRKVTADFERHGKTVTREQLGELLGLLTAIPTARRTPSSCPTAKIASP